MGLLDEQTLRIQVVMLLGSLPMLAVMTVTALWALWRLHARPRAAWIVLLTTALMGCQLSVFTGLWSLFASFGFGEYFDLAMNVLVIGVELAIWWLLLLGLFGPDPFRVGTKAELEREQP